MDWLETLDKILLIAVDYAWGTPLLVLLVVGGFVLTVYCRFLPFRGMLHAFDVIRGKYDNKDDPGQINHFQALSTALSSTLGLGNIAGVAIAITQGGPGAVFWMWLAALVGMSTKFFTCTLAVMYRGEDSSGEVQGGPMYYIEHGLGKKWRFMAILFSICGMIGCLAMFQTNQMAEILSATYNVSPWVTGLISVSLVAVVILGGITRIANVASRLVPSMCVLYFLCALYIVGKHWELIPGVFSQIFHDAFTGTAAVGGAIGVGVKKVIQTGIKRAAFSNEAGLGTAPMAHGAAKTSEPVREGVVAMIGPFIDTIIVCSLTAFVILTSAQWEIGSKVQGVALTVQAFESSMGAFGKVALVCIVALFGISTMFGYAYYGKKCFNYLFGVEKGWMYEYFYLFMLLLGAVWSADMVVNFLDTAFAMMALPNMIATLLLAPRVMAATRDYFRRLDSGEMKMTE